MRNEFSRRYGQIIRRAYQENSPPSTSIKRRGRRKSAVAFLHLLYTFIDYWNARFPMDRINLKRKISDEKLSILKEIATIISRNIFQMDGLKYIIPMIGTGKKGKVEEVPPMFALLGGEYKKTIKKQKERAGKLVYIKSSLEKNLVRCSSLKKMVVSSTPQKRRDTPVIRGGCPIILHVERYAASTS